jgi:nucleotide-binding universal stress UspA family protein
MASAELHPSPPERAGERPATRGRLRDVLVATDFSLGARDAVERAARLPLAEGARVHLAHVRPPPGAAGGDALEPSAREALRGAAEHVAGLAARAQGRGLELHTHLLVGAPKREIVRLAGELGVELVVLGKYAERPLTDLLLGSMADAVLRQAGASVLLTNAPVTRGYRRPLLALKLAEPGEAERMAEIATEVADPGAEYVDAVHAYAVPFENRLALHLSSHEAVAYRGAYAEEAAAELKRRLASVDTAGLGLRVTVRSGPAADVILEEAGRVGADLIALGSRARWSAARALLGSVTEAVARGATCDVLVARPDGPRDAPV